MRSTKVLKLQKFPGIAHGPRIEFQEIAVSQGDVRLFVERVICKHSTTLLAKVRINQQLLGAAIDNSKK